MNTWQENQLQALQSIQSEQQLFQSILSLGKELGFDHCTYGLRIPFPLAIPKTVIFSNYPTAWQAQYQAKDYVAIDPTVQHGKHSKIAAHLFSSRLPECYRVGFLSRPRPIVLVEINTC